MWRSIVKPVFNINVVLLKQRKVVYLCACAHKQNANLQEGCHIIFQHLNLIQKITIEFSAFFSHVMFCFTVADFLEFCISFLPSCPLLFCFGEIIYPAGFTSMFFERSREVKHIHFKVAAKTLSLANIKDKLSNKCYKS